MKRTFISANEPSRRFSEVKAERAEQDPKQRRRLQVIDEINRLEGEAYARDKRAKLDEEIRRLQDIPEAVEAVRRLREKAEELLITADPEEARRLQCEAEELRTMLHHDFLVPEPLA